MKGFLLSVLWLAAIGILPNPAARLIPRRFNAEAFPFAPFAFEQGGKIYNKIHIKKWKQHVPDMSRILKKLPNKRIAQSDAEELETLVQECCVAETVHWCLAALSLCILLFWRSAVSVLLIIVYNLFGNLPFIMIQRYNRPRLLRSLEHERRLAEKMHEKA
ncbi:MAG: glycosyl-4,4'-diaponeurosporenoate acyltransferase [Oscillospiraceae bacterium]|nr:glycosyl-4,4'-diaponeurosporenoate acyltransferase [Oscillospiraceae bacterium]